MKPVTEREIRACFVNCTKGEAKRMVLPGDLAARPWEDLDFLGWQDPSAPHRAYLVAESGDGLVGVALRRATSGAKHPRSGMCALCLTTHTGDGVTLMTARKAGRGGQQGNSVGTYMCADLACSLYLRGKKQAGPGARPHESLTLEEKVERTVANLAAFLATVTGRPPGSVDG
ncbi:FBP domain-containing protein [Saccharothrix australiensis]|uniref:Treble-clef zinc-finger protein n=1 Tax=Saccharothrix australiensis TaxID=2072 RepID=A0A495W325_9PSEU|nr:FBP domain-containing protein [Saccharothrix australiensis]RKT55500.1 treble-clef zinc-finger protein [Saccharothrix australiensis]